MPKVSVIMSAFNAGEFLVEAVDSILAQTFSDIELILIDDCSTDDTPRLIAKFAQVDRRVVPIFNERNRGLTASLNIGLGQAKGQFAARLDADDKSLPFRLETQLAAFDRNPNLVLVGSSEAICNAQGVPQKLRPQRLEPVEFRWVSYFTSPIPHSSAMFKLEPFRRSGTAYDEHLLYAQDKDYWQRLLDCGDGLRLDDVLVNIRHHPAQISNAKRAKQAAVGRASTVQRLSNDFPDVPTSSLERLAALLFVSTETTADDINDIVATQNSLVRLYVERTESSKATSRFVMGYGGKLLVRGARDLAKAGKWKEAFLLMRAMPKYYLP